MSSIKQLAYIAIASRDPEALHRLLSKCLGLDHYSLKSPDGPIDAYGIGETAIVVFPVGSSFLSKNSSGVDHLAFATAKKREAALLLTSETKISNGIDNLDQIEILPELTQGVSSRITSPLNLIGRPTKFIERLDHIGIASNNNILAESIFCGKLGLEIESRQTDMEIKMSIESFTSDKYGVIYKNRHPETMGGLKVSFITIGDTELEFLENFNEQHKAKIDHGQPGNTKQDQGAITKYVEKHGPGLHHLAFKTPNINLTLEHLDKYNFKLIDTVGREGSRRALIGFIHPAATGGVLIHFVQREELINA
ncbi:MAG: VOC family protein [Alphaproteobacteria bacterium]|nr:VOC family protein [Alphaproteobacteria bacterium]MDG1887337.1 VOC family protein [Alphaproteobacteria bacterium]|tara:strand:- start:1899 stop:2825 length:927 start_codon:yes stop_codon:yes gene_type:complete